MSPKSTITGLIPYHTDLAPHTQPNTSPQLIAVQPHPHTPPSALFDGHRSSDSSRLHRLSRDQARKIQSRTELNNGSKIRRRESSNQEVMSNTEISVKKDIRTRWPRGSDFLASTCAFTLSLHSLWSLPISVIQHGGVTFLLMYTVILATLGAPLLLLEMSLGQYSGLAPAQLFIHLCPILAGLGLAVCVQAAVRAMMDMAVVMWAGKALWQLFTEQNIRVGFFYRDVLNKEDSSLEELGQLVGQLSLVLAIGCVSIFILMAAGTRSVGKVCLVAVPACLMLLVTLTIRTCLATGGPHGVLILLTPDWSVLTQPSVWLEATGQVIFSLQLGLGAVSAYSSYNTYQHNIVRDCAIIICSHLVWVILSILLTFSLLGVAHNTKTINLTNLASDPALISMTGHGVWLAAITLIETSLANISTGWLWAGLFFMLLLLVSITSVFGYLEVITSSLISIRPTVLPFKPALTFTVLAIIFLLDLALATQGGIHVYHFLLTYISNWPTLLFSLLTVLATVLCHGTGHFMKDLSYMSKLSLPYWVTSHLSVIYFTILPIFLISSLSWQLHSLTLDHLEEPLSMFSMSLPPLAWCLSLLPLVTILLGAILLLLCGSRFTTFSRGFCIYLAPTDVWHRNSKMEMTESDA